MNQPRKLRIETGKPMPAATRLKQLPEESRDRIFAMLNEKSYAECVKAVESDFGIRCSEKALRSFRDWHFAQRRLDNLGRFIENTQAAYQKMNPAASKEQIREMGIALFMAEAANSGDSEGFYQLANLELAERTAKTKAEIERQKLELSKRRADTTDEALKLEREKFEFDAAKACLAKLPELKTISGNSRLTETEKVQQIRLKLFGELPQAASTP